ncbi:MAG TPA: type II toxin-antitoxin system VapC family toxin [Spirochaetota bacterium]|mgnify:CR=1 FL=1|nr:type II toxin-antitoxin system VapC family toxin [Spirochaetota bacterium]HNT12714.1 type II toxin-antitoxin system VapC family toxin [Spirochaetota bacterium]HNV45761.1 type II toxin-antitoxin system VapC family toxin [Spirochaetota bacterium]HOS38154.1 type II toxin-antitoxin system VapC family toxin [Spirochaetota bacterium]HPI22314.1 type II toxin-antitoxin system VapC family toxin [Spirochaetota bacterium]
MLIDTDVLIWYLRGNQKAFDFIERQNGFTVSVITYMELVQGMRDKQELNRFRKRFLEWNASIMHLSEDISTRALYIVEKFYLSHSLEMADALIAATALVTGLPLATCNDKHFRSITGIELVPLKIS